MDLHFIINPAAKNGYSLKIWQKIETMLEEKQIKFKRHFTKTSGDGTVLARDIASNSVGQVYIIAVGGDGTVHEVVNGVYLYSNVIIGYIPAGSGNDFSRGFSFSLKPYEAFQQIMDYYEKRAYKQFDIGYFIKRSGITGAFINNFGCGFDAKISRSANQSKLKPILNKFSMGKLIYVFYLIKEVLLYQPSKLQLCLDGRSYTFDNTWFVTVSNQPFYGGGMEIAPMAEPNDGVFDIIVVNNISRLKLLFLFITVFWGGHTRMKEVSTFTSREIKINTATELPLHADGEDIGLGVVNITIRRNEVSILSKN
ncbi:diacylglycerol/lipid kinase family protein [Bacillus kwashiorkori]|uniref:diacylglycerol/lipid kinase family protein n=1 Tax=Bacillus kwashiorkori TaxID=1522318 RepID=UPI00078139D8|nr:diacylglycerol kinase family protein [Bacillus kwashiorkori]